MKDKFTALGSTFCVLSALVVIGTAQAQEKSYPRPELLIEPSQLAKPDVAKNYIVLDARNHTKFKQGHVPNAVWVNGESAETVRGGGNRPGSANSDPLPVRGPSSTVHWSSRWANPSRGGRSAGSS